MIVKLRAVTSLTALTLAGACGKAAQMPEFYSSYLPPDGSNINGVYMAELAPLNKQVSSVQGSATVHRKGDRITAMVKVVQASPHAWHPQKIYLGSRCPTMQDDTNGDGFIDAKEGERAWDKAIMKGLLDRAGVATPPWVALSSDAVRDMGAAQILDRVVDRLGSPGGGGPAPGGGGGPRRPRRPRRARHSPREGPR
jgi:hypothetical protein